MAGFGEGEYPAFDDDGVAGGVFGLDVLGIDACFEESDQGIFLRFVGFLGAVGLAELCDGRGVRNLEEKGRVAEGVCFVDATAGEEGGCTGGCQENKGSSFHMLFD